MRKLFASRWETGDRLVKMIATYTSMDLAAFFQMKLQRKQFYPPDSPVVNQEEDEGANFECEEHLVGFVVAYHPFPGQNFSRRQRRLI